MRIQVLVIIVMGIILGACAHVNNGQGQVQAKLAAPAVVPDSRPPPAPTQTPMPQTTTAQVITAIPQGNASATPTSVAPARVVKQSKPAASKPARNLPTKTVSTQEPASPPPTQAANAPKAQLDFKAMEQRLRDTSAIGVFTKLSIKNQVDDLLKQFRGYHSGHVPPTLDELHSQYDGLVLKVVTLVQNDDATLASSISASRGAIWEKLSNKESFLSL